MTIEQRWLLPQQDMDAVLDIERSSFPQPWTRDEFAKTLREHNGIGKVAVLNDRPVGFMVYLMQPKQYDILNIAVAQRHRRQHIGQSLVMPLIERTQKPPRKKIIVHVRESNMIAQLFFKACGFRATRIERGFYGDFGEDAYRMVYIHSVT